MEEYRTKFESQQNKENVFFSRKPQKILSTFYQEFIISWSYQETDLTIHCVLILTSVAKDVL